MDLSHINFGARANRGGGVFRNQPSLGKRLGRGKLDFQPLGELVGVAPNVAHLLARVAWNQFPLLSGEKMMLRMFPDPHDTALGERCAGRGGRGECPKLGRVVAEARSCEVRGEDCAPDKALASKGLRVDSKRHKSCTREGCRESTAWG